MARCEKCGHDPDALTEREAKVAALVAEGLRNAEIGERLGIGESTVKAHVTIIFQKLGVHNRVQMTRKIEYLDDGTVRAR